MYDLGGYGYDLVGAWQLSVFGITPYYVPLFNVRFDVKFFADPNDNWAITASPVSDNYVNVIPQQGNEHILDETWSSYGRWLSGLVDQDVAHAMGHFFLLPDDYSRWTGKTKKGHEGHMMSSDLIRNAAQHEVNDILAGHNCGCTK